MAEMSVDEAIEWYEGSNKPLYPRFELVLKALRFYRYYGAILSIKNPDKVFERHTCRAGDDDQFIEWLKAGVKEYRIAAEYGSAPNTHDRTRLLAIAEAYENCLGFLMSLPPSPWPCELGMFE